MDSANDSIKILSNIAEADDTRTQLHKQESVGYEPQEIQDKEIQDKNFVLKSKKNLRKGSKICAECGCDQSCKLIKPTLMSVSTSIDHFGQDL